MLHHFAFTGINLGFATVQVWGFFVVLGFTAALYISLQEAKRDSIDPEIVWDVMILSLLGMIIGGRLFYYFSNGQDAVVLTDAHTGFSLIGGIIASGLFSILYLHRRGCGVERILNLLTLGLVISLISVRVGCFLVGDHIGRITYLPWAMEFADGTFRHPVTLYEIIFLLFLFFIIHQFKKSKPDRTYPYFLIFSAAYAVFRLAADFLRCDDLGAACDGRIGGLTWTQWAVLFFLPWLMLSMHGYRHKA